MDRFKFQDVIFQLMTLDSLNYTFFVDAGRESTVAHVVIVSDSQREVALISSETKLDSNKSTSIPRMERQRTIIGTRIDAIINEQNYLLFVSLLSR